MNRQRAAPVIRAIGILVLATLCVSLQMTACSRSSSREGEGAAPRASAVAEPASDEASPSTPVDVSTTATAQLAPTESRRAECRRPGELSNIQEPSVWTSVSIEAFSDLLGNQDGLLTGYEQDVGASLDAMAVATRCWLAVPTVKGTRLRLERLVGRSLQLDCGNEHHGVEISRRPLFYDPRWGHAALVERGEADIRVSNLVVTPDGDATLLSSVSPLDAGWMQTNQVTLSELGASVLSDLSDSSGATSACGDALATVLSSWASPGASEATCPVERLQQYQAIGDRHREVLVDLCDTGARELATLEAAALMRCPIEDDAPYLEPLLWAIAGVGDVDLSWTRELIHDRQYSIPAVPDHVRIKQIGDLIELPGCFDDGPAWAAHVSWLSALASVPLGLADRGLNAALEQLDDSCIQALPRRAPLIGWIAVHAPEKLELFQPRQHPIPALEQFHERCQR